MTTLLLSDIVPTDKFMNDNCREFVSIDRTNFMNNIRLMFLADKICTECEIDGSLSDFTVLDMDKVSDLLKPYPWFHDELIKFHSRYANTPEKREDVYDVVEFIYDKRPTGNFSDLSFEHLINISWTVHTPVGDLSWATCL